MTKGEQFREAFDIVEAFVEQEGDLADACVTLAVHAGIAFSDVICCARLGRHPIGDDHSEAIALLKTADEVAAKHLATLLGMKTLAAYSQHGITRDSLAKAKRAMNHLYTAARTAS
jgi:hypothetical protein